MEGARGIDLGSRTLFSNADRSRIRVETRGSRRRFGLVTLAFAVFLGIWIFANQLPLSWAFLLLVAGYLNLLGSFIVAVLPRNVLELDLPRRTLCIGPDRIALEAIETARVSAGRKGLELAIRIGGSWRTLLADVPRAEIGPLQWLAASIRGVRESVAGYRVPAFPPPPAAAPTRAAVPLLTRVRVRRRWAAHAGASVPVITALCVVAFAQLAASGARTEAAFAMLLAALSSGACSMLAFQKARG